MSDFLNWMFRNRKTGRITIGQMANAEQLVFQAATVTGVLLPRSPIRTGIGVVAILSLTLWSLDEIVRGVNPFRRLSGVFTLGAIAALALRKR